MQTQRRSVLKKLLASIAGVAGFGAAASAMENKPGANQEIEAGSIVYDQDIPLFSGHTKYGGLVYIAGKGAHVAPFEIKAHTEIVLKELEEELKKMAEKKQPLEMEIRLKKPDSSEYNCHLLRVLPVKENGTILKWAGTFTEAKGPCVRAMALEVVQEASAKVSFAVGGLFQEMIDRAVPLAAARQRAGIAE